MIVATILLFVLLGWMLWADFRDGWNDRPWED